jgi:tRNA pseudouridine38-40 synthase
MVWFDRPLLAIDLVANGFLRHMVRTIVGTLLLVGRHRLTPAAFEEIVQSRERRQAGPTVAPHGLTLIAVGYPSNVISDEMQPLTYEDV